MREKCFQLFAAFSFFPTCDTAMGETGERETQREERLRQTRPSRVAYSIKYNFLSASLKWPVLLLISGTSKVQHVSSRSPQETPESSGGSDPTLATFHIKI